MRRFIEKILWFCIRSVRVKVSEDFLLNHQNLFLRNLYCLQTLWNRLIGAIKTADLTYQNTIFVDGHPILNVLNCEALYRLHKGSIITKKEVDSIVKLNEDIVEYIDKSNLLDEFQQIIYYINLPIELNLKFLKCQKNLAHCIEDKERDYLNIEREIINSRIFNFSKNSHKTKIIEVNTLDGLNIINMYLLGPTSC